MSLVLLFSIAVRLGAMGWSILLWRRVRDHRMAFLTAMLALMALRQILTLAQSAQRGGWQLRAGGHMAELPGLAVSLLAVLAVVFLERLIMQHRRDADALRQRDQQLQQAQKMEAVGQLAGGVAHDFNNLLTVIRGNLELAQLRAQDPARLKLHLDEVREATDRASALTRQLLAFGRKQAHERKRVDLNRVLSDIQPMMRRLIHERVELIFDLAPELPTVDADPAQIGQVLMNLVLNGQDAIEGQGTIRVCTLAAGDQVEIRVIDSGHGVSHEVRERLFEPFVTTKPAEEGTGLGLSICREIAHEHGGEIALVETGARGTTFSMRLPGESGAAAQRDTPVQPAEEGHEVLLVVEDDPQVRRATVEMLASLGYDVRESSNGIDALARLDEAPDVALVLADVMMPQMGGVELRRRLARERPELPVLLVSGYSDSPIERGVPLLAKPFTPAQLGEAVRRLLDGREGTA